MSELRLYEVVDDHGNTTTMQLNEVDAKRLHAKLVVPTPPPGTHAHSGDVPNAARTSVPTRARRAG